MKKVLIVSTLCFASLSAFAENSPACFEEYHAKIFFNDEDACNAERTKALDDGKTYNYFCNKIRNMYFYCLKDEQNEKNSH